MHGNEHGNSMLAVKCTVHAVSEFESSVQAQPDSIVQRLRRRQNGLCDSVDIQHVTLLTLGSQRILDEFEGLNKEIRTEKKRGEKPIVGVRATSPSCWRPALCAGQPELGAYNN